jgi:hypothetical protein
MEAEGCRVERRIGSGKLTQEEAGLTDGATLPKYIYC